MATPEKIGNGLECFPLVNNLPHCGMMNFKLLGNGLINLPIIAGRLPLWHCVNTQLNAPDQQTAQTSAFIEMLTFADDQLIK